MTNGMKNMTIHFALRLRMLFHLRQLRCYLPAVPLLHFLGCRWTKGGKFVKIVESTAKGVTASCTQSLPLITWTEQMASLQACGCPLCSWMAGTSLCMCVCAQFEWQCALTTVCLQTHTHTQVCLCMYVCVVVCVCVRGSAPSNWVTNVVRIYYLWVKVNANANAKVKGKASRLLYFALPLTSTTAIFYYFFFLCNICIGILRAFFPALLELSDHIVYVSWRYKWWLARVCVCARHKNWLMHTQMK